MNAHFFFERAFRPFFLGGALFSVLAMTIWASTFTSSTHAFASLSPTLWHAHEMIFGYALATVTGFLLTAVMNWSGLNSASGNLLAASFACWLLARLGYLINLPLEWVAALDIAFNTSLFCLFSWPIWQKKLWNQAGLAAKFLLLLLTNLCFYSLLLGWQAPTIGTWQATPHSLLLIGLFLVLAINLTMIKRTLPFFTEKSLGLPPIKDTPSLNRIALIGFLLLMLSLVIAPNSCITTFIAWPLALAFAIRGYHWFHPNIKNDLLLWPLHLSYGFITLGIFLFGFVGLNWLPISQALHAMTAGGIGLLCSAMMARISLGHTNRNVFSPPKHLKWVFVLLFTAAVFRVLMPILLPAYYAIWIGMSQLGWILGFGLLAWLYWPILTQPKLPNPHNLF